MPAWQFLRECVRQDSPAKTPTEVKAKKNANVDDIISKPLQFSDISRYHLKIASMTRLDLCNFGFNPRLNSINYRNNPESSSNLRLKSLTCTETRSSAAEALPRFRIGDYSANDAEQK